MGKRSRKFWSALAIVALVGSALIGLARMSPGAHAAAMTASEADGLQFAAAKGDAAALALSLEMAKPGNLLNALDAYLAHPAAH